MMRDRRLRQLQRETSVNTDDTRSAREIRCALFPLDTSHQRRSGARNINGPNGETARPAIIPSAHGRGNSWSHRLRRCETETMHWLSPNPSTAHLFSSVLPLGDRRSGDQA